MVGAVTQSEIKTATTDPLFIRVSVSVCGDASGVGRKVGKPQATIKKRNKKNRSFFLDGGTTSFKRISHQNDLLPLHHFPFFAP